MSSQFEHVQVETQEGVLVVRIQEQALNIAGAIDKTSREMSDAVEQGDAKNVLLDFAAVTLISSIMLGKLISLNNHVKDAGGKLVLCNLQPQVYHVFAVTRLTKTLNIQSDLAEGLASF